MTVLQRMLPEVGELIRGRYELKSELGRGGFGVVFLATQRGLDEDVAIKILLPHVLANDETLQRFQREVAVAKGLRHPNTIRLLDYDQTESGLPFYVMEYVKGSPLNDVLKEGPISAARSQRVAVQVLKSLDEAHSKGVVHRDLKPGNIMLCEVFGEPDFVKVLDFGIAKALTADDQMLKTSTGMVLGTPGYMSPEQALGRAELDGRSDLYSVGLIMAECLAGVPPVVAETPYLVVAIHASKAPLTFPPAVTGSPLWPIVQRATAKNKDERFANAGEMRRALESMSGLPTEVMVTGQRQQIVQVPSSGNFYQTGQDSGSIAQAATMAANTPISGQYSGQMQAAAGYPQSGQFGQHVAPDSGIMHQTADPTVPRPVPEALAEEESGGASIGLILLVLIALLGAGVAIFFATQSGGGGGDGEGAAASAEESEGAEGAEASGPSAGGEAVASGGEAVGAGQGGEEAGGSQASAALDPQLLAAFELARGQVGQSVPRLHTVRFDGTPEVSVTIDGVVIGVTPFETSLPERPRRVEAQLERDDYESSTVSFLLADAEVAVELERERDREAEREAARERERERERQAAREREREREREAAEESDEEEGGGETTTPSPFGTIGIDD